VATTNGVSVHRGVIRADFVSEVLTAMAMAAVVLVAILL
jgi:hypothetical protein